MRSSNVEFMLDCSVIMASIDRYLVNLVLIFTDYHWINYVDRETVLYAGVAGATSMKPAIVSAGIFVGEYSVLFSGSNTCSLQ